MRYFFLLLLSLSLFGDTPLSLTKERILELKRQKVQKESSKLKNSWISPLGLSAKWQKSSNAGRFDGESKGVSLRLNQDIFRSGGIWYAIDYAKALSEMQQLGVDLEEASLLKELYMLKAQILRDTLRVKQGRLRLQNREIDVKVVKENYQSGNADISQLSRVTIDSDNARNALIDAKSRLRSEKYALKKLIGDASIQTVPLPQIPLIDRSSYLQRHLALLELLKQSQSDQSKYKVVRSQYLPRVSLNANYGYSRFDGDFQSYEGREYGYGLEVSMPLDINAKSDIQASKIASMQTKLSLKDKKEELAYFYDNTVANIQDFEAKIEVAAKMLAMYEELYQFTAKEVKAGLKTKLDLDSLANSKKIQALEREIQGYNILLEKMKLFFDLKESVRN